MGDAIGDDVKKITLQVNGVQKTVEVDPETPLLYVLRDNLELKGPKFGCGKGQCGTCTVLIGGEASRSCQIPIGRLSGANIVTLEGLGTSAKPSPVQEAFIIEQAAQCGYCINGMVVTATAFLKQNKNPTDEQIKAALAENLCRCGTHSRIVSAVKRAAKMMA